MRTCLVLLWALPVCSHADDGTLGLPCISLASGLPSHQVAKERLAFAEALEKLVQDCVGDRRFDGTDGGLGYEALCWRWTWETVCRAVDPMVPILRRRQALWDLLRWLPERQVVTGEFVMPQILWDWIPRK